jgi:Fic family protein
MLNRIYREKIKELKNSYDSLKVNKESLLTVIDQAEVPESVYNSNAIENSTLTLKETERILLEQELSRHVSLREVYEAKNLARVVDYTRSKAKKEELTKKLILLIHKMLIGGMDDDIAGRFRQKGEYVRVGTHIGSPPEHIERLIDNLLLEYLSDHTNYFIDKIAKFHLEFERIHPFLDGNGRIGRVIINFQLLRLGFPRVIIRNKEKDNYYLAFKEYDIDKNTKPMEKIIALSLIESLHKRLAYLQGSETINLSNYVKEKKLSAPAIFNAARRQSIPAFRERGVWKIAKDYTPNP